MLRQVAEGVLIHQSEFCQSNAVVVQGQAGALLIDAGIYGSGRTVLYRRTPLGDTLAGAHPQHAEKDQGPIG